LVQSSDEERKEMLDGTRKLFGNPKNESWKIGMSEKVARELFFPERSRFFGYGCLTTIVNSEMRGSVGGIMFGIGLGPLRCFADASFYQRKIRAQGEIFRLADSRTVGA